MSTFLSERRRTIRTFEEHFSNLFPEQIYSIKSLEDDGFKLYFVRCISKEVRLAVVSKGKEIVVVESDGTIVRDSHLKLRT